MTTKRFFLPQSPYPVFAALLMAAVLPLPAGAQTPAPAIPPLALPQTDGITFPVRPNDTLRVVVFRGGRTFWRFSRGRCRRKRLRLPNWAR